MPLLRLLAGILILAASTLLSRAHQVASVELEFQNLTTEWQLLGEMDIAYMLPETRSIPDGQPLSREAVMKSPPQEMARIRKETENTLRKLLRFSFAGRDLPWQVEFPDFERSPFALPPEAGDIALITTRIRIPAQSGAGELRIHWAGELDTELIILTEMGEDTRIVSTLPGGNLILHEQAPSGATTPVQQSSAATWLLSGFRHVIPLGMDHMLFILGLFLLVPKWRPLLGQSLLFTLAHSITLALAVLGLVEVPGKWVEILIAVSIAWIGIENLIVRKLAKTRLFLVFGFGLLHGLGFASVLSEKLGGIPRDQLTGPLLGFNLGVELAQITVVCAAFLILLPLRKWTRHVQTIGSVGVALAGLGWMIERLLSA